MFNYIGDMIISKTNINALDVSYLTPGMYILHIKYNDRIYINRIIKQ